MTKPALRSRPRPFVSAREPFFLIRFMQPVIKTETGTAQTLIQCPNNEEVGSRSNSQPNSGRETQYIAQSGKSEWMGNSRRNIHELSENKGMVGTGTDCCCSVAKSCPTLCDLMNCSTPGFPVLHSFPEFAQTHVC